MTDAVIDFLKSQDCERQAYLGDGVYVGHDGFQVWLVTERTQHPWGRIVHNVALEPAVQAALLEYLRPKTGHDEMKEGSD